jgi:hypothetical protein
MSTNKEATRKKMEEGLWSGQSETCICGHHVVYHHTEGERRYCELCKECNEYIADAFYANSNYADEILERI